MNRSSGILMDADDSNGATSSSCSSASTSFHAGMMEMSGSSQASKRMGKRARNELEQYGCKLCGEALYSIDEAIDHLEFEHGKDLEETPDAYIECKTPRLSMASQIRVPLPAQQPQNAAPESHSPLEGKRSRVVRSRYSCSACSSTNNNYIHMINHVNNKHVPSEGAKLIVNNIFEADGQKNRTRMSNPINEKLTQKYQITHTDKSRPLPTKSDESEEDSEVTLSETVVPKPAFNPSVQRWTTDRREPVVKPTSALLAKPTSDTVYNKFTRLIEKQSAVIEESVLQINEKSSSLDKKISTMTSHVDNVNTRLDYMDNRLMSIEQKLTKLMRLIGN